MDNSSEGLIEVARQTAALKQDVVNVYLWTVAVIIVALLIIFACWYRGQIKQRARERNASLNNQFARADAAQNARYGRGA